MNKKCKRKEKCKKYKLWKKNSYKHNIQNKIKKYLGYVQEPSAFTTPPNRT